MVQKPSVRKRWTKASSTWFTAGFGRIAVSEIEASNLYRRGEARWAGGERNVHLRFVVPKALRRVMITSLKYDIYSPHVGVCTRRYRYRYWYRYEC